MSRLEEVIAQTPIPSLRPVARLVMALVAALLVWSYFGTLDEVAVAVGEVVPQGQIKTIQHLEGGIIEKINVSEGDVVEKNTPLVQLDVISTESNRKELSVRLDRLQLTAARLVAESKGADPEFPEDIATRRPRAALTERQTFEARKRELISSTAVLVDQMRQRDLEAKQIRSRMKSSKSDLVLARREFAMSSDLLSQGLVSKIEHLQLEREIENLEGEVDELSTAVPRSEAAIAEAQERIRETEFTFRRRAGEELIQVETEIARLHEALTRATDRARRMEIRSPISGVVKRLRYHTIGGVVRPGEAIMEIVPTQEKLVIEAKLSPRDIGYVRVGQSAMVKISTYEYVRYGGLAGQVISVSPDSQTDSKGQTYFRVVVRTDRTYLGNSSSELPITPGMQATADIHTGEKSILEYLIQPILKLRSEAFRER